ncbi:MAG: HAMP domain-containing sensor histidine kinase [Flavobacteriales bacterium]|jgi:signal transduction histidine kinase|nr:HAMP domain-containing sensor histidine kinase [Flavobacteriales bacterium]
MPIDPAAPDNLRPADDGQAERLHRFAHDIRNRLAGMHQALRHLAEGTAGVDRAELAEFGERQFFKALRETEDLLDEFGVDRSAALGTTAPVHLAAVVRTAMAAMGHRLERKGQQLVAEIDEGPVVNGNTGHLDRIISALLSNASKFSAEKSTILVRLTVAGDQAVLTVQDPGIGLSPADLDRVFVRYAWLPGRPTAGEAQGRGTLARMRELARAHGGDLEAASPGTGQGTTFTLRLPFA